MLTGVRERGTGPMWLWGATILAGAALAVAGGLLGFALRSECDGDDCTVGPTVDLIAAAVAVGLVAAAVRRPRARPLLLAAATLVLLVPLLRSLFAAR